MRAAITADERSRRLLEELSEVERMTRDELRAEARKMLARGGPAGEIAGIALEIDARRTWGVGSTSGGTH